MLGIIGIQHIITQFSMLNCTTIEHPLPQHSVKIAIFFSAAYLTSRTCKPSADPTVCKLQIVMASSVTSFASHQRCQCFTRRESHLHRQHIANPVLRLLVNQVLGLVKRGALVLRHGDGLALGHEDRVAIDLNLLILSRVGLLQGSSKEVNKDDEPQAAAKLEKHSEVKDDRHRQALPAPTC